MAYLGRNYLIQVLIENAWVTVMGLRSAGIFFAQMVVDATSNQSAGWRQILNDSGNQTATLTGSGVFKNSTGEQWLNFLMSSRNLNQMQIIDTTDGSNYQGSFKVSKLSYTGDYNGARTYEVTIESSGPVVWNAN